ncbi:MAG: hypothetical protein ABIZ05_08745, partial [Pseudonocardiaceae bacterium]
ADELAKQVSEQWKQAALERRLEHPKRIPLRWRRSDRAVTGPVAVTVSGTLNDLLDVYGGLESGRLIILGGPGSGKTSAAIMLLLESLKRRAGVGTAEARARVPVPVMLTLHGWDPNRKPLVDWLANRLEREYEFLMALEYGSNAATALIKGGHLMVILDGLDEIPEELFPAVLSELHRQVDFRLIVVTRSKELADAVSGGHLVGAAALELCPVEPRRAAEYLASCQIHPPAETWQRVIKNLRADPGGILAQALDTPLMVSLVRDVYGPGAPVEELLDRGRFPSRDSIEDHLLDRVLPIAYARHPNLPAPPCTADQARERLGFLARRMNDEDTRELAWWRIPRWLPVGPRALVSSLVVGFVGGLVPGLAAGLSYGLKPGLAYGLAGGLCWGLVFGLGSVVAKGYSQQSGWLPLRTDDTRTSLMFGLVVGIVFGIGNGISVGLSYGPATGLAIGLVLGVLDVLLVRVAFVLLARIAQSSAETAGSLDPLVLWRRERRLGLQAGLVFGLTAGLAGGLENVIGYVLLFTVEIKVIPLAALGGMLLTAPPFGVGVALASSATWTAMLANAQLRRHGKTSVRLLDFLEDARDRGVLRCVGPMYQFRHARLQDRLAEVSEMPQP